MRLGFTVDVKGNVPVKVIARTFASGNLHTYLSQLSIHSPQKRFHFNESISCSRNCRADTYQ